MVLSKEQPDFIVFNGDMVSGWEAKGVAGWFENRWRQLTAPAREFSIPYAIILGNHDDEANLDRRQILQHDIDTSDGLSHTQQGPFRVGGASNYHLDIFPSSSLPAASASIQQSADLARNNSEFSIKVVDPLLVTPTEPDPAARLWFFDSMNRGCLSENNAWGCIPPTAIQWASAISKTIPIVPTAMAFVHIPIPQAVNVWEESSPVFGAKGEFSNCQGQDTGLHQFAKENGVQAVWSGHDHVNDFEGVYEGGIRIGYGRKTGYGSYYYGPPQRGARIIELKQGESAINATSWIALESGVREYQKVVNKMMLDGPPEQTECRNGAKAALRGGGVLWWLLILAAVILS
jgi:hypothetical protein